MLYTIRSEINLRLTPLLLPQIMIYLLVISLIQMYLRILLSIRIELQTLLVRDNYGDRGIKYREYRALGDF